MTTILACIDERGHTDAVIDWAAWAAVRLAAPLEFLHVLERHPEHAESADYSGTIGIDAQASLLQSLSAQDEQRSRVLRDAGRALLAYARTRAAAAGVTQLDARLRHGDFVETAIELQPTAGLVVIGEHRHADPQARPTGRLRGEHHLEQVVRAVATPVLVVTTEDFAAPRRVVVAFDGGAGARRALTGLARHPLVAGLPVHVVMVGADTPSSRRQLREAERALADTGVAASSEIAPGAPQQVLPALVKAQSPSLLVMGAYGHSRLRQWLVGSTTTTLLRLSDVPVLVLR